ncbi:MAG: hypothetical protein ACI83B_000922 [Sediminicola sp.]|jgi:hypothetical protein|tara:strand:- start:4388 stop:4822 length:435 start_codon:yes stop_codon:yes gene_type:complete
MAARKIIGYTFSIIAVLFSLIVLINSDVNIDFKEYFYFSIKSYFSLEYLRKITPLIICSILLYGGIILILKPPKINPVLALFGFTVLEKIAFSWFDIIAIGFPVYVVAVFFCCALISLWIVYSDTINLKRLSLKEGVFSLILGL